MAYQDIANADFFHLVELFNKEKKEEKRSVVCMKP